METWESNQPEVFFEKVFLKNLLKFTGKHLCRGLSLMNFQAGGTGCFPVNFSYFLITRISWNTCEWLLPKLHARKLANYAWFVWINSVIIQDNCGEKRRHTLVFDGKGIKRDLHYLLQSLNFPMRYRFCPTVNLFIIYKVRHNLCMNAASLHRESLGRVS